MSNQGSKLMKCALHNFFWHHFFFSWICHCGQHSMNEYLIFLLPLCYFLGKIYFDFWKTNSPFLWFLHWIFHLEHLLLVRHFTYEAHLSWTCSFRFLWSSEISYLWPISAKGLFLFGWILYICNLHKGDLPSFFSIDLELNFLCLL